MKYLVFILLLSSNVFSYRSDLSKVFDVRHAKIFGVNENYEYDSKKFRCPQGFKRGLTDGRVNSCVNESRGLTPIFIGIFREAGSKKMSSIIYNFEKIKACSKRGYEEAKRIFDKITYKETTSDGYYYKGVVGSFFGGYACKVSQTSKRLELVPISKASVLEKTLSDIKIQSLRFKKLNK